jgi:hypothetical protein
MNRVGLDPRLAEMESLFATERELAPEPDEVRQRAVQRARASLPRMLELPRPRRAAGMRRMRIGEAAAAAVLLTGLCALAFEAGYRMKTRSLPAPVPAHAPTAAPSVIVVSVPALPSADATPRDLEPPPATSGVAPVKPAAAASSPADAYAMELRVLQPAQRAVARQDYASALAAIATHQRRFPSGRLAEEREALRVKALLGLGRTSDARRAGVAFGEHFPQSALRGRIDTMLRTDP